MLFIYKKPVLLSIMGKEWQYKYQNAKKKELLQEFSGMSNPALIDHILELRTVIEGMQKELKEQEADKIEKQSFTEADYKQEWSYPTKIAFILTVNQKPLTSEDLHNLLLKVDTHYKDYDKPRNNLTVTLNRALKSGRIRKVKVPGIRSLYYVLPEWFDKEGELKKEFKSIYNNFQ